MSSLSSSWNNGIYIKHWEEYCLPYFVGWIVFLETLFNELDLKPDDVFLLKKLLDIFVRTWTNRYGHRLHRI